MKAQHIFDNKQELYSFFLYPLVSDQDMLNDKETFNESLNAIKLLLSNINIIRKEARKTKNNTRLLFADIGHDKDSDTTILYIYNEDKYILESTTCMENFKPEIVNKLIEENNILDLIEEE